MTPEERFERIEDSLLRASQRMDRGEARMDRFEAGLEALLEAQRTSEGRWRRDFESVMEALRQLAHRQQDMQQSQEEMQRSQEEMRDQQRLTQASLDKLILNIDRFIRARAETGSAED